MAAAFIKYWLVGATWVIKVADSKNAITWESQESVKGNCSDMHVCICQPMYPKISIRGIRCVKQCLTYGRIDATPEEDGPLFEFPKRSHHWLNCLVLVESWYPISNPSHLGYSGGKSRLVAFYLQ